MIHEIRIKNMLSFKDEQVFSFEASNDRNFQDLYTVEIKPNLRLLKLGIIYGANASGKTNFLLALNFLRKLVLESRDDKFDKIDFIPFLLDEESKNKNGEYFFSFFIGDIRYIYSLEFNSKKIVFEKLIYYPTIQPALIFKRNYNEVDEISNIEFGGKLNLNNKQIIILEGNTIKNSTVLSIYNKLNLKIDLLDDVINWFKNNFSQIIRPETKLTSWISNKIENELNCKNFIVDVLKKADFNISDIVIDEKEEVIDDDLANIIQDTSTITDSEKKKLLKDRKLKLKSISFLHSTSDGEYKIPMGLQSTGTKRYYGLGGVLNEIINNNKIITIDELESSLHYELVNHFLKTFLVNTSNSQLLFTTHNINILMEEFIRRDVIWFCEKNKAGATELYSAIDVKLHKNISLFNAYKIGKLGAKPNLGDIYLETNGKKNK